MTRTVSVQYKNDQRNHRPEMVLRIDTVGVAGDEFTIGPTGFQVLGLFVECGIHIRDIPSITEPMSRPPETWERAADLWGERNGYAKQCATAVRSLLAVPGTSRSCRRDGVRKMTTSGASDFQLKLLSGVQQSQTIRSMVIKCVKPSNFADRRHEYWQWMAFALFSPYATHRIKTLELQLAGMLMKDINAIHQVLTAGNPFTVLQRSGDPTIQPRRVQATDFFIGVPVLADGDDDGGQQLLPPVIRTETPVDVLLVGGEKFDGSLQRVHFPGSNETWIESDNMIEPKDATEACQDRAMDNNYSFQTVIIRGIPKKSRHVILALFRFIGRGINHLEIHDVEYDEAEQGDWVRQILMECPDVESLIILSSDFHHLEALYSCYESGHCRVQRLTMGLSTLSDVRDGVAWRHPEHEVWGLVRALTDPMHQMSRHVRDLDIDITIQRDSSIVTPVEKVINQNLHLRLLRIHFRVSPNVHETVRSAVDSLCNGWQLEGDESTKIKVYGFGHCRKLASLSVVKRAHENGHYTALGCVDSVVADSIFQFAADCFIAKIKLSVM